MKCSIRLGVFALTLSRFVFAAACCGGGAAIPGLITSDDRIQTTVSIANSFVRADATVGGQLQTRSSNDIENAQNLRADFSKLLSDRWQWGVTVPLSRRSRSRDSFSTQSTGLGDVSLSLAYEWLPEWSYSAWKPKSLVFASAILPTGTSVYESRLPFAIDSRGRGYFGISVGTLFMKTWGSWDSVIVAETHRFFPRTISTELGALNLMPGWGARCVASAGWSPGRSNWRLGASATWDWEEGVGTSGLVDGLGSSVTLFTTSIQVSWMVSEEFSLNALFSDQTLFALSSNSPLTQSVSIMAQKRWGR
jgi:hypothetical protein